MDRLKQESSSEIKSIRVRSGRMTEYPMVSEEQFILQRSFLVRIILRRLILSLF